jgi:hypothetical protein
LETTLFKIMFRAAHGYGTMNPDNYGVRRRLDEIIRGASVDRLNSKMEILRIRNHNGRCHGVLLATFVQELENFWVWSSQVHQNDIEGSRTQDAMSLRHTGAEFPSHPGSGDHSSECGVGLPNAVDDK